MSRHVSIAFAEAVASGAQAFYRIVLDTGMKKGIEIAAPLPVIGFNWNAEEAHEWALHLASEGQKALVRRRLNCDVKALAHEIHRTGKEAHAAFWKNAVRH